ncbi:hypothetical protein HNR42_001670 [Deinobacterium chartae]|uniref:Type 4 fimbrial biogenesis protein PilX N-terminal domain-containing protein n=1 Tax=Deinobacterium chartae TaxID=521158 RepID=A0A841I2V2_9DEIO|nr:hypothetical protein [Deinobacterium chartae]MBB6098245.1 hypothetical protein [Deinobacterium chartae]
MRRQAGYALITVLVMLVVLMALLTAYFVITRVESVSATTSADNINAFYAAEAGLNLRAEKIRSKFLDYQTPQGITPDTSNNRQACTTGNQGSQDFACESTVLGKKTVLTYVTGNTNAPEHIIIPPDEGLFSGLNASQYTYTVNSEARSAAGADPDTLLQMRFKSRQVPMFQFAAFFKDDLEILPSPNMTLNGRVHTNSSLYLGSGNTLTIRGQTTYVDRLFRGRKNTTECTGVVRIYDPVNPRDLPPCSGGRTQINQSQLTAFNGQVAQSPTLTLPTLNSLDPSPVNTHWDKADLRIMLVVNKGPQTPSASLGALDYTGTPSSTNVKNHLDRFISDTRSFEVRDRNGVRMVAATNYLNSSNCTGALGVSKSFYNYREKAPIYMLEVDYGALRQCIINDTTNQLQIPKGLANDSGNGMVWYFGFADGGTFSGRKDSNLGVRIRNARYLGTKSIPSSSLPPSSNATLSETSRCSTSSLTCDLQGLTIVSNQAVYLAGDFNVDDNTYRWRPASILADSINVLSNAWAQGPAQDATRAYSRSGPAAQDTEVNAAFLAGTDISQGSNYSGGLENYPRFHENWGGKTLFYSGSFVSLGTANHVNGIWRDQRYDAPLRAWDYDRRFDNPKLLPPLAPQFVYLRQELFARQYER